VYASVENGQEAESLHIVAEVEEDGECAAGDKTDRILSIVIPHDNPHLWYEDES